MIPGTTWMNMLLGESQTVDEMNLSTENEEQPPMKKLCTPNNTFVNNRTGVDTKLYINSTDNLRNSRMLTYIRNNVNFIKIICQLIIIKF